MGIMDGGAVERKCPVDMDWMLAGYAFPRWVSDASLSFFESEEQPHVKEVNEVRMSPEAGWLSHRPSDQGGSTARI
jgi:hypothetical protein